MILGIDVIEGVPISWEVLTPSGLLGLFVLFVLLGKLTPIGRVRDEQQHTTFWRTAATNKDKVIANQAEALRYVCEESGLSVSKVMGELQDKAGVPRE